MAVEVYKITETDSAKIINYRSMNARGKLREYGRNMSFSRRGCRSLIKPGEDRD